MWLKKKEPGPPVRRYGDIYPTGKASGRYLHSMIKLELIMMILINGIIFLIAISTFLIMGKDMMMLWIPGFLLGAFDLALVLTGISMMLNMKDEIRKLVSYVFVRCSDHGIQIYSRWVLHSPEVLNVIPYNNIKKVTKPEEEDIETLWSMGRRFRRSFRELPVIGFTGCYYNLYTEKEDLLIIDLIDPMMLDLCIMRGGRQVIVERTTERLFISMDRDVQDRFENRVDSETYNNYR